MRASFARKADLVLNNISDTDSYKFSHFLLYPDDMEYMESYFEARGGEFTHCTVAGLIPMIHKAISKPITEAMINEEEKDAIAHGEPFNREGWLHILHKYRGHVPVTIRAVPEGLVVPVGNAIMVVRSPRDPKCAWITNWLETQLSRVWYTSTVAIASREIKRVWKHYLDLSSDNTEAEISFKHHDFGSRGVTCPEQAMLGGMAHLLSFLGSDTFAAVKATNHYYDDPMAGFSIPATEHSTMTIFGEENEENTVVRWVTKTLIEREVPPGVPKLAACVGDSWDIFRFVRMVCQPRIRELVKGSGGTLVIRPDSGPPVSTLRKIFDIFEECLPKGEITTNSKGFKVLPAYFRIIWGDGINRRSMKTILQSVVDYGWSVSNLAFGSGGGLLMDFDRDIQKFAFKCCAVIAFGGKMVKVSKNPVTDPSKRSKEGRMDLIRTPDGFKTIALPDGMDQHPDSVFVDYYDCGYITYHTTLKEIRARMAI
jgi:nicotinamide phosphoribosyltransferase